MTAPAQPNTRIRMSLQTTAFEATRRYMFSRDCSALCSFGTIASSIDLESKLPVIASLVTRFLLHTHHNDERLSKPSLR
jgi:hypothetical protein